MDNFTLFSRRDFLRGAGAFGAASLSLWLGGCEACLKQIEDRPTRKNIATLSASDPIVTTYKAAVAAMKALPSSDPRNWTNQANIHFNNCTHGNWFFLPWHRGYLLYFERICRKLTGDDKFALPYWNWTTHPAVPDVFFDTASPLFDPNRGVVQGQAADPSWVSAPVIQNILSQTNFDLFASGPPVGNQLHFATNTGMLEGNPHNNIHGWIDSSDMGTFMSPLDPVFWTHHNMLDCLWVDWNLNMGNSNTNDPAWVNQQFHDFFDENGNPASITVIDTVLYPIFLYQFEPCGPNETKSNKTKKQLEEFVKAGAPSKWEVSKHFELAQSVRAEVGKAATGSIKIEENAFAGSLDSEKRAVVLTLGDVEIPEKRDFFVRVFLSKSDVSAKTAIDDVHYAGSFGLFADDAAMKAHQAKDPAAGRPKAGFVVNITPTLRKLSQAGSLPGGALDVTLVPVPYERREAAGQQITLGRLDLKVVSF